MSTGRQVLNLLRLFSSKNNVDRSTGLNLLRLFSSKSNVDRSTGLSLLKGYTVLKTMSTGRQV